MRRFWFWVLVLFSHSVRDFWGMPGAYWLLVHHVLWLSLSDMPQVSPRWAHAYLYGCSCQRERDHSAPLNPSEPQSSCLQWIQYSTNLIAGIGKQHLWTTPGPPWAIMPVWLHTACGRSHSSHNAKAELSSCDIDCVVCKTVWPFTGKVWQPLL